MWGDVSSDYDGLMIVSLQFSQIVKLVNKANYADTDIIIDKGPTCSFLNNKNATKREEE